MAKHMQNEIEEEMFNESDTSSIKRLKLKKSKEDRKRKQLEIKEKKFDTFAFFMGHKSKK